MDDNILLEFKGMNGKTELYSDKLIIKRGAFQSVYFQGHIKGEKTIFLSQISSVQLKRAGLFNGYIQFTIPGGNESLKGVQAAYRDENSIVFSANKNSEAEYLKKEIEDLICAQKCQSSNKANNVINEQQNIINSADEIRKFKQLLDDGIITSDEYEKKKSQLLNI
jgi:hypothetical protein